MYNFFADEKKRCGERYYITDGDYNHIKNVLRMRIGEKFLVSANGKSDLCVLEEFTDDSAVAKIETENYQNTALPIDIYLFQGLPKSDKMELIIQKAVELGVKGIIPVEMARSIVKTDEKKKKTKQARWQAVCESAAKQSKRTVIPKVYDIIPFKKVTECIKQTDLFILPYENKDGMDSLKNALSKIEKGSKIGILIGPEGGFDEKEVDAALKEGAVAVSLGKRILRTETAAIVTLAACMLYAETYIDGEEV